MSKRQELKNKIIYMNRRQALRTGAVLGTGLLMAPGILTARGANEKLNIACIGIGGRGRANVNGVQGENIVALCDVDDDRAGDAYEKFSKAKKFYDYRVMFDQMESEIDAVVVSTPDHTHFHPSMIAMDLGKHLYCEKPMAHAVGEIRQMTDLAKKKGVATQLGVQRHTLDNMHRVVEIIKSGAIGDVTEVHSRVGGSRGMPDMPEEFPPVPEHLKWDLWVGPAEKKDYSPAFAPYNWRFWWDYGTGEMGNWGCHILDIPYWALDLEYPVHVSASGPEVDEERSPKEMFSTFEFPERGDMPAMTLHWNHTTKAFPYKEKYGLPDWGNNLFIGTKGALLCDFSKRELFPKSEFADYQEPDHWIEDSPGFHKEWIIACKGGEPATCHFGYTGPMAESVILANTAYRSGENFDWDYKTLTAKDAPKAEALIHPEYRKGWKI